LICITCGGLRLGSAAGFGALGLLGCGLPAAAMDPEIRQRTILTVNLGLNCVSG